MHDAWSELAVRTAIADIVADASADFDPEAFWPGHPGDDGVGDGNPSFYYGAAGVIWALDYLHRVGASPAAKDFRAVLPKLLERTTAGFERVSPAGYAKHGSLLFGDMGAALLAMRLDPTPGLADLVHARAEANTELPIRELMWGMPGSMLAAIRMAEMTRSRDGVACSKRKPPGCWMNWRKRRKAGSGPRICTAPRTAGSDLCMASPATSFRCCVDGTG